MLRIQGANFVPPGAGGDLDVLSGVIVRFRSATGSFDQPVRPTLAPRTTVKTADQARGAVSNPKTDQIDIIVPGTGVGAGFVMVITAAGAQSNEYPLTIAA